MKNNVSRHAKIAQFTLGLIIGVGLWGLTLIVLLILN